MALPCLRQWSQPTNPLEQPTCVQPLTQRGQLKGPGVGIRTLPGQAHLAWGAGEGLVDSGVQEGKTHSQEAGGLQLPRPRFLLPWLHWPVPPKEKLALLLVFLW